MYASEAPHAINTASALASQTRAKDMSKSGNDFSFTGFRESRRLERVVNFLLTNSHFATAKVAKKVKPTGKNEGSQLLVEGRFRPFESGKILGPIS